MSVTSVAESLDVLPMVIRSLEGGYLMKVRNRLVLRLCAHYGITDDDQRAELLRLARGGSSPGWWSAFADVIPTWFGPYLALEQSTDLVRSHDVQFVPGLLQTADYARAVIRGDGLGAQEETDYRVALRMRRQRRFLQDNGPQLWALLDESVFLRPVADRATMFRQFEHLAALCDVPNISIQIVPFGAVGYATGASSVILLRTPRAPGARVSHREIVYLEQLTDASYVDDEDGLLYHRHVLSSLSILASTPSETQEIIHAKMRDV